MKIARFSHAGTIAFGIIDDDELVVLTGDPMFAGYNPTGQRLPLVDVALLAPVIPRSKVVGLAGAYFADAVEKAAVQDGAAAEPRFFLKPNTTVVGPNDPIVLPAQSEDVRVEGELAIVIGKVAKNLSVADASSAIFGYTIANDVTAVDLSEVQGHGARAKSFDSFCPLGPVIDTEFDPTDGRILGRVDATQFQNGDVSLLAFSMEEIVSFLSHAFTLLPGDVILTGSPSSAQRVTHGDSVSIEIPGLGVLTNPVRSAA
ncbi:fumarylacetoacetate hydrolase family protein [Cryobacterium arcticum]|uniref:2-hydroxyhepta-2,4-diene-1,7-dioate isomerase n=1 Tax=Cryobacterium arcticum TaxID=670052 RepID=A0A1B1BKX7_9MICO|nr:fumarylacetoacetate hydrolase family protein [Cryobacterium arcticum]ANP73191.1 2-hydroxyhepta-2,4-diene-1,7-dioate isomerase [Cryobacterium arcticum]